MSVMKCPNCGKVIEGEVSVCPLCQTPLQTYTQQSIPTWIWAVGAFVVIFLISLFVSLGSGDSGSDKPIYSKDYYTNPSYREDVGEIADAFGESEETVDAVINKMSEELKKGY